MPSQSKVDAGQGDAKKANTKGKDAQLDTNDVAKLTASLVKLGCKGTDLASIVKADTTRRDMADALIEQQRRYPKAEAEKA